MSVVLGCYTSARDEGKQKLLICLSEEVVVWPRAARVQLKFRADAARSLHGRKVKLLPDSPLPPGFSSRIIRVRQHCGTG